MNARTETLLSRALLAERTALRQMEPSAALDARFEHSLEAWRAQRLRSGRQRRLGWALVAGVTGVLVLSTGWLVLHVDERPADRAAIPDSRYAQWVAAEEPAVLRVRASLGAQLPASGGDYWIDVGVAGDGTLYIERVTPIDGDPQLFVP